MDDEIPISLITPEVVGEALCLLEEADRLMIEMACIQRLGHAEIGSRLKLSRSGVIHRVAQALARLRFAVADVLADRDVAG